MRNRLSMREIMLVGNWINENKEIVQTSSRAQTVNLVREKLGIEMSIHSVSALCKDLGIKLKKGGNNHSKPAVNLKEVFILANELRILATDLGYGTTKEFNEVFNKLKKQLEEEN